jgi:uncharacterized membrane protein
VVGFHARYSPGFERYLVNSMSNRLRLLCTAAVVTLVASCGDDHDDGHGHGTTTGVATKSVCPTTQTLTYDNFGQSFMAMYCLRCHSANVTGAARAGAPTDHNFDERNRIQTFAAHIDEQAAAGPAATNVAMPPSDPKPSEEERRKLGEWLACMAP